MFSTSPTVLALALALSSLFPHVAQAAIPPIHLSRRAADAQSALVLDPSQLSINSGKTGQEAGAEAGQVPSLTSQNNFLNFCLTQKTDLTNGLQVKTGSCNPTIMGRIAATDRMPSAKFVFPPNMGSVAVNTSFTIQMKINNLVTGNFVNANQNYYAAPCQVDSTGTVIGHSHVVIEKIDSLASTTVTNPNIFVFFKGLNGVASNGILTADVAGGLPAGAYRMASINACANHQPVLAAVAQHGSLDDGIYFSVVENGTAAATTGSNSTAVAANSTSVSLSASLSAKATGTASLNATSASLSASLSVKATATTSVATGKAASSSSIASTAKVASSASPSAKASTSARPSISTKASTASQSTKASTSAAAESTSAKAASNAKESSSAAVESSSAASARATATA